MKNILIPTDFSDNAWNTLVYALKLYEHETCRFFLLHASHIPIPVISSMNNDLIEDLREKPLQELATLKEQIELTDASANHEFETLLLMHDLITATSMAVKEHDIDMVIMGTKGASNALEKFLGTNTLSIVHGLKTCPVLIVPKDYEFVVPKEIAFPSDFHRFYNGPEVKILKDFAELYNSKVRVVHICTEKEIDDIQEFNKNELGRLLIDMDHSFHWMPDFAKKAKAIDVFIEELEIDVLAMVRYKHSFLETLLKEPVIDKLGISPKVPFMVIPEKKQ